MRWHGALRRSAGLPLGIQPSTAMAMVARQRGIQVVQAVAEALPFMDETFDFALMVTTSEIIAFEIHVLRPVIC